MNSPSFKKNNPWIGSDIKVLGFRNGENYCVTLCIPQIATQVHSTEEYKNNLVHAREFIKDIAKQADIGSIDLSINTRDNFETSELYLTATGSSIESGDEGLVGRGNRVNGIISPMRLMSMEGACGKNPVYHIGKIYYVAANEISKKIYTKFAIPNEVAIASQSGRDLLDPWITSIAVPQDFSKIEGVKALVEKEIKLIPKLTNLLIEQKLKLY